ncbi:hypothetical protein [uncultured Erythrobacter sp.]|uniref:hypothetical protein n=1 Tax=uncultured Erythrobacter sp. TaxID=263913 RepID=UPI002609CD69|nr:hypothetical protein [uncultured Erythrobacter sp.]
MTDQEAKMIEFVRTCVDAEKLRGIAANAHRSGAEELFRVAKLKLFEILPNEQPGTFEHDVWQSIFALEDALSTERGKTIRLARTRQKIARVGELQTVKDLILGTESEGFKMLAERSMLHLAFEAVALRHSAKFEFATLEAARERLTKAGYHSDD